MSNELPNKDCFLNITIEGDFKLIDYIDKGCFALVFRGYSETLKQSAAYKVIPRKYLAPGDSWKIEPQKANSLRNQSVVHCQSVFDYRDPNGEDYVVLRYEYVEGTSLQKYINKNKKQITIPFIKSFLMTMLGLFYELKERNIQHGDFHARNILVATPSEFLRNSQEEFKVTDFGTGGITSSQSYTDDFEQLARVLGQLLECINYQKLTPENKHILNVLNDHFREKHLIEKDCTRDALANNPGLMLDKLESLEHDYLAEKSKSEQFSLLSPFDYLSCEQIGRHHSLLRVLYSDKFLGISEIESANNLVVTGPRGCGKSTVFRSLSFNRQLLSTATDNRNLTATKYIGIYYHCNDLYFKFPRYSLPENSKAIDLPIHYLISRLLIEILEFLQYLLDVNNINTVKEVEVSKFFWETLGLKRPSLPNADSFAVLVDAISKDCQYVLVKHRNPNQSISRELYNPEALLNICEFLQEEISFLSERPFFCFIDDYSMPHISMELQQNLNRLLMHRNGYCFFKMATESPVSFAASDIDDKAYVEGREFEVLNLGLTYLREEQSRKLEFLEDVFTRRFKAVENYPVSSLLELIGEGDKRSHNEIARNIAGGNKTVWWGIETFCSMCSGDLHQLITLARKMVSDSGGELALKQLTNTPKISSENQNKAIRTHAGDFLKSLADSGENGAHLRQIVTAFGNVAHSYVKYKCSKNEDQRPQHQAIRIELREAPDFDGRAKELYDDLIRYSIFIQDPRGKSLSGQLVPRLHLRKFLVPHFNLTFSGRDSLLLGVSDFKELILNPEKFEARKKLKYNVADNYQEAEYNQDAFDFSLQDNNNDE
jgi:serine/threonine protein kinase